MKPISSLLIVVCFIGAAACSSSGGDKAVQPAQQALRLNCSKIPNASPDGDLNLSKLTELISTNNVTGVDQLIPLLPQSYRSNFTLMYESRGFAEASFDQPKVISYGKNGHFLVTFTGSSTSQHSKIMEVAEYNDCERAFDFREISFVDGVRISERNPAKCVACHGADPRPLWDNYPYWRGAFGSFTGNGGEEQILPTSLEGLAMKKFLSRTRVPSQSLNDTRVPLSDDT